MLGPSHTVFTMGLSYVCGGSVSNIIIAGLTTYFPDGMEKILGIRIIKHRTITHELFTWLIPAALLFIFLTGKPYTYPPLFETWSKISPPFLINIFTIDPAWLFVGPIFHLLADSLTPAGITILGKKVTFSSFAAGSVWEHLYTTIFSLGCGAVYVYIKPSGVTALNLLIAVLLVFIPAFVCRILSFRIKDPIVILDKQF